MNQRKLQAVINRINDDVKQYKSEIRFLNKNERYFTHLDLLEKITHFEGKIDEAYHILRQLEMLKESIKG